MNIKAITRMFIKAAGAILLFVALERFLLAAGRSPMLGINDSLLGIPLRYSLIIVSIVSLFGAWVCLFGKKLSLQLTIIGWFGLNFLVLKFGLPWMQIHPQLTGIGARNDPLLLSRGVVGHVTGSVPFVFLLGSVTATGWMWIAETVLPARRSRKEQSSKMSCPSCGVHIRFDLRNLGQTTSCPQCKASIKLRKPENLKMSCFFCKENIEFPAHALGEKLKCPHCKRDITLKEPATA